MEAAGGTGWPDICWGQGGRTYKKRRAVRYGGVSREVHPSKRRPTAENGIGADR